MEEPGCQQALILLPLIQNSGQIIGSAGLVSSYIAAAVRAKPIGLTGLAAMIGAVFILDDPIFNGLAISLIFGVLVSTLLTLVVIPVLYYAATHRRAAAHNGAQS